MNFKKKISINLQKYKKIAIWGSGGLAKTALKYWLPYEKIIYCVDSYSNKKKLLNHKIISPKEIMDSPPDLILVCSSAYVEIFSQIKKLKLNIDFKYVYELFLINHDLTDELANLKIDILATKNVNLFELFFRKPQIFLNITYRISRLCKKRKITFPIYVIFYVLHYLVCLLTSIQMPVNMKAGPGLIIAHPGSIVFSEKAILGSFVTIYQCCTIGKTFSGGNPIIGDFVTIFTGSNVLGGCKIGSHSIIGAMSLLLDFKCQKYSTIVGIPAVVKKKYNL